jgi:hypothetical protein
VKLGVVENGAPTWIGDKTVLPNAYIGKLYSTELVEGMNFSDPDGDAIASVSIVNGSVSPSWLTISQTKLGTWTLSGTPNETTPTNYEFGLEVKDATSGTIRLVKINVLNYVAPSIMDIVIKPTANTNYEVDKIATMFSGIQTAPDGLATFRISVDVTPMAGKAIMSGAGGGTGTATGWGIGLGVSPGTINDFIFTGSDNEWADSISNIKIVDFNANGGVLTEGTITAYFKSINIINAQSTQDAVSLKVNGVTSALGKLASIDQVVDLKLETGVSNIEDFAVGVGNSSTTNKWSVEGINVLVTFNKSQLSVTSYLKEDRVNKLIINPNPSSDYINLNVIPKTVHVFDMTGKCVKSYFDGLTTIDISSLKVGIFIIEVRNAAGVVSYAKLIKQL